jgi:hypothetical protein
MPNDSIKLTIPVGEMSEENLAASDEYMSRLWSGRIPCELTQEQRDEQERVAAAQRGLGGSIGHELICVLSNVAAAIADETNPITCREFIKDLEEAGAKIEQLHEELMRRTLQLTWGSVA